MDENLMWWVVKSNKCEPSYAIGYATTFLIMTCVLKIDHLIC
jgi:hypothetical protein